MKTHLFLFLLISTLISACNNTDRIRKKPPVPSSPNELITGCYYIVEDSLAVKKTLVTRGNVETYYIDPKPIVTVGDFEEASVVEQSGGHALNVKLNEKGKKAFAEASKKYIGKKLAFIVYNELIMAPQIHGEISGGVFEISGNFKETGLNRLLKMIHYEMYEQ